jgi:hypothetical protein
MRYDERALPLLEQLQVVQSAAKAVIRRRDAISDQNVAAKLSAELQALKKKWGDLLVMLEPLRLDKAQVSKPEPTEQHYNLATVLAVFLRGTADPAADASVWRRDACGAWICSAEYGNHYSPYGWEIDQIGRVPSQGTNGLSNLRPLQWQNKLAQRQGELVCVVTGYGGDNREIREKMRDRLARLGSNPEPKKRAV